MSFPNGPDPKPIPSDPNSTLDGAQHTQLHNDAMERIWNIQEYLVGADGSGGLAASLPSGGIQSVRGVEGPAEATWDPATGEILFKIPRGPAGTPGAPGTNGKDGTQITSGVLACPGLAPSAGPKKFPVNFPAGSFTGIPKVFVSSMQKTTGTVAGSETVGSVQSTAPTQWRAYTGKSPYGETKSTSWEGTPKQVFLVGQFGGTTSTYGNQRSIVLLPGAFSLPAGAVPTGIKVTFKIGPEAGHALNQVTIRPASALVLPSNLNPADSPKKTISKTFSSNTSYTEALDTTWIEGFLNGTYNALVFGPNDSTLEAAYGGIVGNSVRVTIDYRISTPGGSVDVLSRPVLVGTKNITNLGFDLVVENLGSLTEDVDIHWMAIP